MKYHVVVFDRAARMLERHIRFLAQVSKDTARRTKNEILSEIRALDQMPLRWFFSTSLISLQISTTIYLLQADTWFFTSAG